MSSKKWVGCFLCFCLLIAISIFSFNYYTDPFGAFGDPFFSWHSYGMTNNPRVAKTQYLIENHEQYDSFIVGPSSSSSFPVEALNEAFDGNFYHYIMYGSDLWDCQEIIAQLLEDYQPKNIVLSLFLGTASNYHVESNPLTQSLHYSNNPELSYPEYLWRYLSVNPKYGYEKLQALEEDSFFPKGFDVFQAETGAYDKSSRDVEHISNFEDYLEKYPEFVEYYAYSPPMSYVAEAMSSVEEIVKLCQSYGTELTVVTAPMYMDFVQIYPQEEVINFYVKLAEVTDFWDFTFSAFSHDPRFFYDSTHFRNILGELALCRISGSDKYHVPNDFGVYVTKDTAEAYFQEAILCQARSWEETEANLPIIMYHHLTEEASEGGTISVTMFEEHIKALSEAGFQGVSLWDAVDFVNHGKDLPEKSVIITFDDGYSSNYELAYPILQKYNMKATIFVIGHSVGKDTYKETGTAIIPHFSYEEAQEMIDSGLISIQSHTYDMHQWAPLEREPEFSRETANQLEGETDTDYLSYFGDDFLQSKTGIEENTTETVAFFAYPLGDYSLLSEYLLTSLGVQATLTIESGMNTLLRNMPQSLLQLNRFSMTEGVTADTLLRWVTYGE